MATPRRKAHPGRTFVTAVVILSSLVLLSWLGSVASAQFSDAAGTTLSKRRVGGFAAQTEKCRDVHNAKDQCAFIKANCPDEESGVFSYLTLYYCKLEHAKPVAFIIIILWTSLLFTTIGVAASDFFCINLSTISSILGMSESLAGVTFLAFGNGSPDVFSTFSAVKSHSGSLAIGELIGAATFITAVVSGSMALVRPFKVAKRSFVRDIGFFIVAIAFSMVFLANGSLSIYECAIMVAFYLFYVVFVVLWHWWLGRRRRKREREAAARGHFVMPGNEELEVQEEYHDDENTASQRSISRSVSIHDFNDLETADLLLDKLDEFEEEELRERWMGELSSNMRVTRPRDGERRTLYTPIRPSLVGALEFRALLSSLQKSRNLQSMPISMRRYSDDPYYTLAQQQEANASGNGPVAGHSAIESSLHDFARDGAPGRSRAVSANDAAGLGVDRNVLRPQQHRHLLDVSPPAIPANEQQGTNRAPSPQAMLPSPILEVSSPQDTRNNQEQGYFPPGARSGSPDLLTPPGQEEQQRHLGRYTDSPGSLVPQDRRLDKSPTRPHLHLSVPDGRRASAKTPPSPFPPYRDDPSSSVATSKTPSLVLPPPSTSPESYDPTVAKSKHPKPWTWWPYKVLPPPEVIIQAVFPTLYSWSERSIWEKILGICTAPSFFFLTITLPVVEPDSQGEKVDYSDTPKTQPESAVPEHPRTSRSHSRQHVTPNDTAHAAVAVEQSHGHSAGPSDEELETEAARAPTEPVPHATSNDDTWNRWLVLVHCFTSPLFIVLIVWVNASGGPRDLVRATLYCLIGSLVALLFLLLTTNAKRPPRWHFMLCFVGFAVSIAWISTIADEVVGVLKTIGVICNMSDAILGLTIFAVGNSLGDLVADITVARLGFPVMALSACFGGPLLNILLGVGLSGLYMTITGAERRQHEHPDAPMRFKPYHIRISTTLLISAIALLVTLVGLLIVVPLNKWVMDRRIGTGLVVLWVVSTVINVVVELTGLAGDIAD